MKRLFPLFLILVALFNLGAGCDDGSDFNMVRAKTFKEWLNQDKDMILVDIQPAKKFAKHHFAGSIETNAFPVKKKAQQEQLAPALAAYQDNPRDVVVICPAGGGGAERAYKHLKKSGVSERQLYILKGGIKKWPFPEMLSSR